MSRRWWFLISLGVLSAAPALEADYSDEEIETLATKPVVRFAHLSGSEAERAWQTWRGALRQRFPQFVAAEVEQRATELRERASDG